MEKNFVVGRSECVVPIIPVSFYISSAKKFVSFNCAAAHLVVSFFVIK